MHHFLTLMLTPRQCLPLVLLLISSPTVSMVLNIPDKYCVHATFPTTRQVGHVFNKLAPFLKIYTTLVDHNDAALKWIHVYNFKTGASLLKA